MKDKTSKKVERNPYNAQEGGSKAIMDRQIISRPKSGNPYAATKPTLKIESRQMKVDQR